MHSSLLPPNGLNALFSTGYVLCEGKSLLPADVRERELRALAQLWDNLVEDAYLPQTPCPRLRRHAEFIYDRKRECLLDVPPRPYYQSRRSNSLFGGTARVFASFTEEGRGHALIRRLISESAHEMVDLGPRVPIHAHMVRVLGRDGVAGEPSPEGMHQDGFDYVSIHLIRRENACHGETTITNSVGDEIVRITLRDPLDSAYLDDRRLHHGTTAISPMRGGVAVRDVLLLSYGVGDRERGVPTTRRSS